MAGPHKILILDDEQDLLEVYQGYLSKLASQPEIHLANSGARALALLESDAFTLLLTDLNMPTMDGFQVLTIVRRKYPSLKTVAMSGTVEEQFRSRAYAMGIDLFLEKPKSTQEFTECIDALLARESQGGFRGVQSKTLPDIIQMECLSNNSIVLKISNGPAVGRIWILNGDLIDSELGDQTGEEAFKRIVAWRSGHFETLPADPSRTRTIFNSYQGLLLDSAQAIDEASGTVSPEAAASGEAPATGVAALAKFKGIEFVVTVHSADVKKFEQWGCENAEPMAEWTQKTMAGFRALGDKLKAGQLGLIEVTGSQRHAVLMGKPDQELCVGFQRALTWDQIRESMKLITVKWAS
jgi:CheY-like chemotaxis protein